jgi:two-component system NtrC family sensor kinase
MKSTSLSVKLMGAVGAVSLLTIGIFAVISVRTQRKQLIDEVILHASQFSDTVKRSTHHAMLENRWEDAYYIMQTIGKQEGVSKVRIFSKEGVILFSTEETEVGNAVDKRAESCYRCHAAEKPLERLRLPERSRIFSPGNGGRILGMITPIYNEPSCSNAACHAHPESTRVLGVLDIGLSLVRVDSEVASMAQRTAVFAGGMTLFIMVVLGFFLQSRVIGPVRDLVKGTKRVAEGDLGHVIPVRRGDDIGFLAQSFNEMTSALQKARAEVASMVTTLEERVRERTNALQEAQTQLIQSEKLASLGKLAASVAHEINNPLAGILTYAKLLTRRFSGGLNDPTALSSALKSLGLIERETVRCTSIVRNLLDFARQREPSFQETDLNAVVLEALSLLSNRMSIQGVAVEKRLGELPAVKADFGQIRQVFLNIALNGCEAMEKDGSLTVTSRFVPETKTVEVEFLDTGSGIPPDHLTKIFDPFFTSKEKGTGLGLSVVYGIVSRHNGKVEIKSAVGKGTCVTVRLPIAEDENNRI